eukprot:GHRR01036248.1.p1 GENE.GHRR01036248.1~~GHRR01036248.1.p1  ORF type:complete len:212 (+),score=66.53 GHRR01036248.1:202-837(+)
MLKQLNSSLAAAFSAGAVVVLLCQHAARRIRNSATKSARYIPPPHPDWKPPQPQSPPFDVAIVHEIDPAKTPTAELYPLIISAIVPRPIGFVSSQGADGLVNLSPYSYFNAMSHNPPVVAIGICRSPGRGGGKKDTLHNIEETGSFTLNMMSEWFVEAANHTCGDYDRGVDEFKVSGLTPIPSKRVLPPRVKESAVQMECVLKQIVEFKDK